MTHTPEPWYADIRSGCAAIYPDGERDFSEGLHPTDHGRTIIVWARGKEQRGDLPYPCVTDTQAANLHRMVACVNACAGMADPAAELASLRAEVEMLRRYAGSNLIRSDFRTADDMRAAYTRLRAEVEMLRRDAEAAKYLGSICDLLNAFAREHYAGTMQVRDHLNPQAILDLIRHLHGVAGEYRTRLDACASQLASLRAENERLRRALETIRDEHASDGHFCQMCEGAGGRWPCGTRAEADAALNPPPKEPNP